jgi:hypothetical protein
MSNFMKIRPMRGELFHAGGRADGRTDGRTYRLTKLIVTFRNFANSPNNDERSTRGFSCVSARSAEVTNVERLSG